MSTYVVLEGPDDFTQHKQQLDAGDRVAHTHTDEQPLHYPCKVYSALAPLFGTSNPVEEVWCHAFVYREILACVTCGIPHWQWQWPAFTSFSSEETTP